ncbi:hypothetical protein KIL84_000164 [Mauremys mutica]|uniref:Uncharacterized protein n=1 Tax=Mauremys mutica TaxID=74926 RepID=A0A9D3XFB6_9SAUR|nr:hypothetical protein KIL84_000164 [Mauremys mutica]
MFFSDHYLPLPDIALLRSGARLVILSDYSPPYLQHRAAPESSLPSPHQYYSALQQWFSALFADPQKVSNGAADPFGNLKTVCSSPRVQGPLPYWGLAAHPCECS